MLPKTILGYSENVISMVLETLKAIGETGPFHILQNIICKSEDTIPFIPSGITAQVQFADKHFNLTGPSKFVFGVLTPDIKKKVFEYFLENFEITMDKYTNLIHPSSVISSSVSMRNGCYVEPLSVISPYTSFGFGITINRGVSIGHHAKLDDFVTINPGVNIAGHTLIGENTTIGIGSVVFDHLRIGKNCIIGGGSVVTKDIPDNVIAWGNPCKVIKPMDT